MKDFRLVQHTLIPVALFAVNLAVVHFIYLLAEFRYDYLMAAVLLCLGTLATGILKQQKYLLLAGISGYLLLFIFSL